MSGRDVEPVTAFFPSIDRNLMRDLDRQLRGTQDASAPEKPDQATEPNAHPEQVHTASRPDIAGVVEAVEQAAASITAMAERIQRLETHLEEVESSNDLVSAQLAEAMQAREAIEATLRAERDRAKRVEALAAHHVSRATTLERDLGMARADLAKVVAAITQALGSAA